MLLSMHIVSSLIRPFTEPNTSNMAAGSQAEITKEPTFFLFRLRSDLIINNAARIVYISARLSLYSLECSNLYIYMIHILNVFLAKHYESHRAYNAYSRLNKQ